MPKNQSSDSESIGMGCWDFAQKMSDKNEKIDLFGWILKNEKLPFLNGLTESNGFDSVWEVLCPVLRRTFRVNDILNILAPIQLKVG